jgi:hypothetical protein
MKGELEVDYERGVVYFHDEENRTRLRICRLGKIPRDFDQIDVTNGVGASIATPNEELFVRGARRPQRASRIAEIEAKQDA